MQFLLLFGIRVTSGTVDATFDQCRALVCDVGQRLAGFLVFFALLRARSAQRGVQ